MAESTLKLTPAEEKLILALREVPTDGTWFSDIGSATLREWDTAKIESGEPGRGWGPMLYFAFLELGEERGEKTGWT